MPQLEYSIKAIPTTYAGVNFRSRLEARWAAFFDLCGWKWDYEPFDLEGWAPDFRIRTKVGPVLCEVKPADLVTFIDRQASSNNAELWPFEEYNKAARYMHTYAVCLLGDSPLSNGFPIGVIGGTPHGLEFDDLYEALLPKGGDAHWREAGNRVQWKPDNDDYYNRVRRIFRRAA
ncbi:hypothetical protein LB523_12165 [Mesorhizobium sp. ESP-6-4]|uniref:hypothetical protein n=1 Tax=Mesorhizobium sp. ESP-6-4 TaxID=2876624 RepID=UPI001CCBE8DC|nr:hypothetical protein [Mesorhizobium sp. ESP-6-4]MBZ9659801.1 hypothetical protein [Mesorhizobium sp. ESP-6-4]